MKRIRSTGVLALITVVIPSLIALLYFGLLAQDVYISESRIVVRNPTEAPASGLDLALDQTGFGVPNEGNGTVISYLQSRQAITEGNTDGLLKNAYSGAEIFWFDRFGRWGASSDEEFYEYFLDKLEVAEGGNTQVLTIRVKAFGPTSAQAINARLVEQSENLVNSLALRSQTDFIAVAEAEVEEAAAEAKLAALELARFRDASGLVDPEAQSEVGLQMISKLQDELIGAQTRLRQLQTYTPRASQIPFLQTQVRDLRAEIANTRQSLAGGRASLSSSLAEYQERELKVDFAQKQLAIAQASLQDAKAEARRKQAYLEKISEPSLPDYPVEPRRIRSIIATFLLGLLAWGVLTMLAIGVREHKD